MVGWVLLDFLWRVALGLGAVLGLIAIVGLGIPPRKCVPSAIAFPNRERRPRPADFPDNSFNLPL
jgi:MFS family permease